MGKNLFIAEKPSVAREFANALKVNTASRNGYLESQEVIITWCVGHLVTLSYPDAYDEKLKKWSLETLPFIPEEYKYEVIESSKNQFQIVSSLMNRPDVETIYVCTDSGREGEYIYRLVEQMSGVHGKTRKRVWIDSQTEEEILRGIREAKDLSAYDALGDAAYLRAKEDYLMGINFSRALSLKYAWPITNYLKSDYSSIAVGRVMTCVLGIVVDREREIRAFVKTPFYRVLGEFASGDAKISAEWRAVDGSKYFSSPKLYKENGFKERKDAEALIADLNEAPSAMPVVESVEKKKENKNPPLLYNLAELQNECSKLFKINPDQTLSIVQELYEKKMVTYPRTDARVLSTAVAKEIYKNIGGLKNYAPIAAFASEILSSKSYAGIAKTRYVNDKQITDHYAIIPTGQGLQNLHSLNDTAAKVYEVIARRFLSIFYPAAVYRKCGICIDVKGEKFFANFKLLEEDGYLKVATPSFRKEKESLERKTEDAEEVEMPENKELAGKILSLKKGDSLDLKGLSIKEGETSPPKRYTSGSIILTMENAGQFIEDEELRAQIKGSGIGTSATRAGILTKLINKNYLSLQKKTQVLTPTLRGEMVYDVVAASIKQLLDPTLTASWEKGLEMVEKSQITSDEYMGKLSGFVTRRTDYVKKLNNMGLLQRQFDVVATNYKN